MSGKKLLLPVLLSACIAGCTTTYVEPDPHAFGYNYYPVAVGDYRIYNVTDINFKNNVGDTTRYQMREVMDTSFVDQTNTLNYKIVRATRQDENAAWAEDSVMVVAKSTTSVILTRDNTRYVKLVFPVQEGKVWLGDAFNNHVINKLAEDPYDRKEPYTYSQVGEPFRFDEGALAESADGLIQFAPTITVIQGTHTPNMVQLDDRKEVYAEGIGRVYRLFNRVVIAPCSPDQCEFGENYKVNGHERHEVLIAYGHQ
ncbi:hypothetical protein I2I11_10155 [Pontibacter sp. 172403-2]|uniref:hypothetical protein n=1 Tax=Pontibacter rufus TaxID=2791028 RepID=UPI0018AFBAED|nr:hypothetical protein [Pontibacter sp. 172403-2]MBF9253655.1 hypothetical protein [Pontibacter sp. 172403-2]